MIASLGFGLYRQCVGIKRTERIHNTDEPIEFLLLLATVWLDLFRHKGITINHAKTFCWMPNFI